MSMHPVERAHAVVAAFGQGGGAGAWRLDRAAVVDRLHELLADPDLVRQGKMNLCGPAAVMSLWLRRDPEAAVTYAARLFEQGKATIGAFEVVPSRSLRTMAYGLTRYGDTCPQADWMMMAALRDAANRALPYARQAGVREAAAAITMPGALTRWLAATGVYATVRDETTLVWPKALRHAHALSPAPGRDVILLVAQEMFHEPASVLRKVRDAIVGTVPNHWLVLRSPVIAGGDGRVGLRFWSWGGEHTAVLDARAFHRCYHGSLTCTAPES